MKKCAIYLPLLSLLTCLAEGENAHGTVYEDLNRNGVWDVGEPGIEGVAVSNQIEVVLTDAEGRYTLPVGERTVLFVSKPAGYALEKNEKKLPQFYYLHFPEGSPSDFKYPGIAPTGPLPASIDFALLKVDESKDFTMLVSGDPQPHSQAEMDYFRDDVVAEMLHEDAALYLALGDLVFDYLDLYPRYVDIVGQLDMPTYHVHGNHDMNYKALTDEYAAETFRDTFGPEYYSFDVGKVHFIVIDDVHYNGWNVEENHYGGYTGRITERQLAWMQHDLALVPSDKLIVLSSHIPLVTLAPERLETGGYFYLENIEALYDILKDRSQILALSGHTHLTEVIQLDARHGWKGGGTFWNVNPGAACGAWWTGPKDARGVPAAYCMDGSPNGYFVFQFSGTDYEYWFRPVNMSQDHQIRVSVPTGTIRKSALADTPILANVFVGGSGTVVNCRVGGDSTIQQMVQTTISDPFMQRYLEAYRDTMPSWLQDVAASSHLWKASLPQDLQAGMHTIEVHATDHQGHQLTGQAIIEVVE